MSTTAAAATLIDRLRGRGLRVTSQRLVIHRVLCAQPRHMTAEQVLASVSDALPGTSLPTVYATLELFEQLDLVRRVGTGSGAVLFDSRVAPHAHTACRRCGTVSDLDLSRGPDAVIRRARDTGFVPDHAQVVVWGLCPECARLKTSAGAASAAA